jgi:hypothetical protein
MNDADRKGWYQPQMHDILSPVLSAKTAGFAMYSSRRLSPFFRISSLFDAMTRYCSAKAVRGHPLAL